MTRAAAVLALGILVAGAARAGAQAQAEGTANERIARRAASAHIQPGDRIALKVFREEAWNDDAILVNERGEATFPKIGTVQVSRFTIAEVGDSLRVRYARFVRDAELDVVVLRRVAVNGEVRRPDVYYVDVATSLRDAIARAGGLTIEGDPKKVSVVRGGQTTRVRDWQSAEGMVDLQSGDQIYVGMKPWIQRNALGVITTAAVIISTAVTIVQASR
jgi:polysaccharide export outer membrane protein